MKPPPVRDKPFLEEQGVAGLGSGSCRCHTEIRWKVSTRRRSPIRSAFKEGGGVAHSDLIPSSSLRNSDIEQKISAKSARSIPFSLLARRCRAIRIFHCASWAMAVVHPAALRRACVSPPPSTPPKSSPRCPTVPEGYWDQEHPPIR